MNSKGRLDVVEVEKRGVCLEKMMVEERRGNGMREKVKGGTQQRMSKQWTGLTTHLYREHTHEHR
jgi:hypothetical protein